jgi:hypothetical protein
MGRNRRHTTVWGVILFALMELEEEDEHTVFENGLFSEPGQ